MTQGSNCPPSPSRYPNSVPLRTDTRSAGHRKSGRNSELRSASEYTVAHRRAPRNKEEPVPFTVHWLFDTDPEEPGVTVGGNKSVPASLRRYITLYAGKYFT